MITKGRKEKKRVEKKQLPETGTPTAKVGAKTERNGPGCSVANHWKEEKTQARVNWGQIGNKRKAMTSKKRYNAQESPRVLKDRLPGIPGEKKTGTFGNRLLCQWQRKGNEGKACSYPKHTQENWKKEFLPV